MLKTIQAKLACAFGVLAVLFLAVSVALYSFMSRTHEQFLSLAEGANQRARISNDIIDAANARAIALRNYILSGQSPQRTSADESVKAHHKSLQKALAALAEVSQSQSVEADERTLINAIAQAEASYWPVAKSIYALAAEEDLLAASTRITTECVPALNTLVAAIQNHLTHLESLEKAQVSAENERFTNISLLIVGASLLCAAIAAAMSVMLPKSIHRQLGAEPAELRAQMDDIASGRLSTGGHNKRKVLITGSVAAALEQMRADLLSIVSGVRHASDNIATGSAQIAAGNQDLSQRTEEQAANLQQASASMSDILRAVQANATTAGEANSIAGSTRDAIQQGGQIMQEAVESMQAIATQSKKMSEILAVIDGISFQTNILALNAAVEAARAGEQGRGFAVVASEVRSLAQRSTQAAKEIKTLITSNSERIDTGKRAIDSAGDVISDVIGRVNTMAETLKEISSSAADQSIMIEQVSSAISQLDQVTQQNAALVEESAAASESLRHQAASLSDAVQKFEIHQH